MPVKKRRPASKIGSKRRAAGWTLLALGVLVAGVWVWSMFWSVNWGLGGWYGLCNRGQVSTGYDGRFADGSGYFESNAMMPEARWLGGVRWRVEEGTSSVKSGTDLWVVWFNRYSKGKVSAYAAQFVLWPLPLLLVPTGAALVRSGRAARRRAMNLCPKCGYSLAGIGEGAPCPECGTGAAAA